VKIQNIFIKAYSIPFSRPFKTSNETFTYRKGYFISIDAEGFTGYGESAPLPYYSMDSLEICNRALYEFKYGLPHKPKDLELTDIIRLINDSTFLSPAARFGLETAIYDLESQIADQSLAVFLNPEALKKIRINGFITDIHNIPKNFSVLKLKINGRLPLSDLLKELEYISKKTGVNTKLRLDANGSFDSQTAVSFGRAIEQFNIDYLEQPLPVDDLEGMAVLRKEISIPVAIDESLTTFESAEKIIEKKSADVFVIKPTISGGFNGSEKIINQAKKENIRTVITSSLESDIGLLACLHLASKNNIEEACGLDTCQFLTQRNIEFPTSVNGYIDIPERPGLGYSQI